MTESKLHNHIKHKIAESLIELGYDAKTEVVTKEGRIDVLATKDGHELKIEVYKTHIPEWLLVKVHEDIGEKTHKPSRSRTVRLDAEAIQELDKIGEELKQKGFKDPSYSQIISYIMHQNGF